MTSLGSRLKKLREENGYSQRQLAEYLEIDQSNLSKIENDKRKLNWSLSDKIISLYNCTPEYLLGETDHYEKQEILFKTGNDIDLNLIAKINKLSYHLKVLRNLDGKEIKSTPYDNETANQKLEKNMNLKRKWGIDEYSPINIVNLVQEKIPNLTICWFPIKRNVGGACFKKNNDSIILINSSLPKGRQNFNLAHELYHLLNNKEEKDQSYGNEKENTSSQDSRNYIDNFIISTDSPEYETEDNADIFASNFLMSDNALYDFMDRNRIDEWTLNDVIKCEQYFQLDHRNFIYRLFKKELIDEAKLAEFSCDIHEKAGILGYDTSLYEPSNEERAYYSIGHMIPLTERIYDEDKISASRRKEILLELFREDLIY